MNTEAQLLFYLILLLFVDTIFPLPITAGILIYVLLKRPEWFRNLYYQVYK